MIDTVKIYTEIDRETYNKICNLSIVKTSFDNSNGQVFYEIINDHLEGSYSSKLSVRVSSGVKYRFCNLGYCIEIEGSFHKITKDYNSHNGYYDLKYVCSSLIQMVELSYNIDLPSIEFWFLQRCDIAICYDIENQENVKSYINSLSRCNYPRRKMKFFNDESVYLSGNYTTLKIYNKLLEFNKHDLKKFLNTNFDTESYTKIIKGLVRFECEIKKKKLQSLFLNKTHIKIIDINYDMLKKVWSDEFMKLLKLSEKDLEIVRGREEVYKRLQEIYKPCKANRLFNFYCSIQLSGVIDLKKHSSKATYFRYIKDLKNARVDFSQTYKVEEMQMFYFNPFQYKEVA